MENKTCTICRRTLPLGDFRFDNVAKGLRKTRCRECENARMREDRSKHREARREGDRRRYRNRPAYEHQLMIARKFGISDDQAAAIACETQCDLCQRDNGKKRMAVDHCHTTGRLRGVLCDRCNLALGHFGDDAELMRRAADYLASGGSGRFI